MNAGSDLLALQDVDLELARVEHALQTLPILTEIAKKRSTYAKLKAEATRLMAQRKDAEMAVEDLDEAERSCRAEIAEAHDREIDPSDYRQVQDLEVKLSLLAKRLDKIAFDRPEVEGALAEARDREERLNSYITRFEASVIADTKSARDQANDLKNTIDGLQSRRDAIVDRLPDDMLGRYRIAVERFKGIAVERLEGRVPSVCRTALQPASMDALRRVVDVAECPYCHRMLVLDGDDRDE